MKAVLCKAFGPAETLVLEDIASPQAKRNEIVLEVHAAGVNFPDTLSADELINYSTASLKDEIKRLTDGRGANVIYDPVGGDLFDQAIRSIAWNGRLLVVGFTSGRIPELPVNLALLKGAAVVGVFWGAFAQRQPQDNAANFRQLFDWFAQGQLKPLISKIYPLEQTADAINDLGQRKAVGKVVVKVR